MIESLLASFGLDEWWRPVVASAAIFAFFIVLAGIFDKVIFPILRRFTNLTPTDLDTRLVRAFQRPAVLGLVLLGAYLAAILPHDLGDNLRTVVGRTASIIGLLLGVIATAFAASNVFQWYSEVISPRTTTSMDDRLVPLFRRIALALIYGLGALLILDLLKINISPLIAGLGLSGLAVALALQPTLANLFAGTYVMTEGVVTPGDYIELDNGVAGYVQDVSWRSTRLRTWTNNLVVVPNSRFADSIITNYQGPVPQVNVFLTCGISYESDLAWVEQVCQEVMDELLQSDPNAVKEYGSYFGFQDFDDSNVDFYLFVQARNRLASFELRSALIRNLHQRFKEEGIVINYPMRTINLPRNWNPEAMMRGDVMPTTREGENREPMPRQRSRRDEQETPASNVVTGDAPDSGPGPDIG